MIWTREQAKTLIDRALSLSKAMKIFNPAMATICFGSGTNNVARKSGENGADSPLASSGYPENEYRFHKGARK